MMVLGLCHRYTHRGVTHPRWCVRRSSLLSLLSLCNQYGLSIRHRYAKSWFLETQMECSTSVGTHYMHQGLAHELLTFQRWETRIFLMRSNANTFGDDFIDKFSFCFTILTLTTPRDNLEKPIVQNALVAAEPRLTKAYWKYGRSRCGKRRKS